MKKTVKNQAGFSITVFLVIIITLAVVGGTGYYVYNNRSDTTQAAITTTDSSVPTKAKILVLYAWDVQLTIPDGLGSVQYTNESGSLRFSSTLQQALPASCSWSTMSVGPWGITRSNESDTAAELKPNLTHIGDYYYRFVYPQTGCQESTNEVKKLDSTYKALFNTLEATTKPTM